MKNLSPKLEDDIFSDIKDIISRIDKKRNKYINEALSLYKRKLMKGTLVGESKLAYSSFMEVLDDFLLD